MKAKFLVGLAGLAIVAIGCVSTVNGRKAAAVPFVKDRIAGKYERPADQVFNAAKDVVVLMGTLTRESTIHTATNGVLALEGRVNQRNVWISVEQIDPKVSSVIVQARTKGGGSDIELCHELEKRIALKLTQ